MQDNLPKGFSEDLEKFTTKEEDIITIAEECGLIYKGRGDDEELRFMGEDKQFREFDKKMDEIQDGLILFKKK